MRQSAGGLLLGVFFTCINEVEGKGFYIRSLVYLRTFNHMFLTGAAQTLSYMCVTCHISAAEYRLCCSSCRPEPAHRTEFINFLEKNIVGLAFFHLF